MDTLLAPMGLDGAPAAATAPERGYYSVSQAATLLGVSRVTLSRWIRAGAVPVTRLGHRTVRISRADLDQLVQAHAHSPGRGVRARGAYPGERHTAGGRMVTTVPPAPHAVQFYTAEAALLEAVIAFLGEGLQQGQPGLVVATPAHRAGLEAGLTANGVDVSTARAHGQYCERDAVETLAQLLVAGMPDPVRFEAVIGGLLSEVGGGGPLHVFGEMVALLAADGNHAAALRLEELWNALQAQRPFALLCAYPLQSFGSRVGAAHLGPVCVSHSRVLPAAVDGRSDPGEALRTLLATLVETSDDAILTKTLDGIITSWNRAAERLYGYTAAEAIGQPVSLHMPPEQENDFPAIMGRLRRGERVDHYETVRMHKDGRRIPVSITVSPLFAADSTIIGASAIARDISERRRQEAEREAFIAALTHDLKSPLATVQGMAQLLDRRAQRSAVLPSDQLRASLAPIQAATGRMVTMLNELLDIARIQQGQALDLQRADCDLVVLSRELVAEQQALTSRHMLQLTTSESTLVGHWDRARLERVLRNLLTNAVKYSPAGGDVRVTLARDGAAGQAVLSVADQGLGIPAPEVPTLFHAFRRGSNVREQLPGSGIGLVSVQQVVEQHGGTVAVTSVEGQGSTFTVRLPLGTAASTSA
jgi:PAS domain S-box-containing protein/excisionase family DNA binding protein